MDCGSPLPLSPGQPAGHGPSAAGDENTMDCGSPLPYPQQALDGPLICGAANPYE